jgi:hypothetical protein
MGLWRRIDSIFTAVTVTDTYQTVNLSIIQYKDPFFKEGVYDEAADWAVVTQLLSKCSANFFGIQGKKKDILSPPSI